MGSKINNSHKKFAFNSVEAKSEVMLNYQKLIAKHFNFRKEVIPLFSDDELSKLKMPISLFVGEKDIMIHSKITAKRLKKIVEHAVINYLPNEGHSLINQGDEIRAFLNL